MYHLFFIQNKNLLEKMILHITFSNIGLPLF